MNDLTFVYDTYAIIEIIGGNENYKEYLEKQIIINDFIYAELCYVLTREKYPNAEKYLERYKKYIIHVTPESIKKAMFFRCKNKKKKISMTDCVSYFMARELGVKFLTGDKEFEKFEGVEFIKRS